MKATYIAFALATLVMSSSSQALEVGDQAPCVVLNQTLDGQPFEGCIRDRVKETQLYTAIEFFSVICSDCAENLPNVTGLSRVLSDRLTFRLVSLDRAQDQLKDYVSMNSKVLQGIPVAHDIDRDAKRAYGVSSTPTLFVLDRNHQVVFKHIGILSENDLIALRDLVLR